MNLFSKPNVPKTIQQPTQRDPRIAAEAERERLRMAKNKGISSTITGATNAGGSVFSKALLGE